MGFATKISSQWLPLARVDEASQVQNKRPAHSADRRDAMTFLDETLALAAPPIAADFDAGLAPTATVLQRIPDLAGSQDSFKQFLEGLSTFLQPGFVGDDLQWTSDFGKGLVAVETELRAAAIIQSTSVFGKPMTLDELAAALEGTQPRDANIKRAVGGLLSGVLTKIENTFMRAPGIRARTRATTLTGFVKPSDFRTELIKRGRTWKDSSVPWTHGEFTHRIQWCAAMAVVNNPTWGIDYLMIGQYEDAQGFGFGGDPKNWLVFGLWDAIVDRNPYEEAYQVPYLSASKYDFRGPENLQRWLLTDENLAAGSRVRLMASFLRSRAVKRNANPPTVSTVLPNPAQWDVWCRRLFGNNVKRADLSVEQKGVLARAWIRLTRLDNGGQPINPILVIEPADSEAPRVQPSYALKVAYKSVGLTLQQYNAFPVPG